MEASIQSYLFDPDLYVLAAILFCAGVLGWATNWLAVQLTFYPVQFKGPTRWLGWQGIIPAKAEKMAAIVVDKTLSRLGDLSSVFQRLEPELITHQIIEKISPRIEEIIDDIMEERQPVLWNNLPQAVRHKTYDWARQQLPKRVEALVADFGERIDELVDFKSLVVSELRQNPDLMNRIFQESGEREFGFIIRSGFWFGCLLGAVQAFVGLYFGLGWYLIIGGFLIGTITNWLALTIIFQPVEPRLILGLRLQGLFLQRQAEVAKVWSRLVARELLTVERVAHAMVHGVHAHKTHAIIQKHIRPALDKAGVFRLMTQLAVGAAGFADLKDALQEKAIAISTTPFHDVSFNQDRADVVAQLIYERMAALPPKDFQDVLRPAFREEEWQLILIGGCVGAMAGWLQYLLFNLV